MSTGKENPVIILVVVLALVAYALWSMKSSPAIPSTDTNQVVDTTTGANNGNGNGNGNVNTNTPLSYSDALAIYKNARIQLDTACRASPSNITYKDGTSIMIDNRAPVARTVKVNSVYTIPAYGFKIIKLSSAILPATWLIDCDKSQNVATIIIQE